MRKKKQEWEKDTNPNKIPLKDYVAEVTTIELSSIGNDETFEPDEKKRLSKQDKELGDMCGKDPLLMKFLKYSHKGKQLWIYYISFVHIQIFVIVNYEVN